MEPHVTIYGFHALDDLLKTNADIIIEIWYDAEKKDPRYLELIKLARDKRIKLTITDRNGLHKLAGVDKHQGLVAICHRPQPKSEHDLDLFLERLEKPNPLLLILDGLQDPHNLGACMRTASAAGVDAIIAPHKKAVSLTSVVFKVASGAAFSVPFFQVTNLARVLKVIKSHGIWLVGTNANEALTLYEFDFRGPLAIIMGGEGAGMRRLTKEHCDYLIKIPMLGSTESLNVSVATAICLYEALRQRLYKTT